MPERRVTCSCGRSFVTDSRDTECDDCRAYTERSFAPDAASDAFDPPAHGRCTFPSDGPWRDDTHDGEFDA